MKKYFPVFLLLLGFLIVSCLPVQASNQAIWSIEWNSDNSLNETVIIKGHNGVIIENNEWNISRSEQELKLTRRIKNWEEYDKLNDKIPLKVEEKDLLLVRFSSLASNEEIIPGSLYDQFTKLVGAELNINVPGIIRDSTATARSDSALSWTLSENKGIRLDMLVVDGVIMGISLFALAFIIIFLIFLSHVKKVNQLIDQEYSLEKAAKDFTEGEINKEEEKS